MRVNQSCRPASNFHIGRTAHSDDINQQDVIDDVETRERDQELPAACEEIDEIVEQSPQRDADEQDVDVRQRNKERKRGKVERAE